MSDILGKLFKEAWRFRPDQRGVTGLETAIVLIAFVMVPSVFAFAALSTCLSPAIKPRRPSAPASPKPGASGTQRPGVRQGHRHHRYISVVTDTSGARSIARIK